MSIPGEQPYRTISVFLILYLSMASAALLKINTNRYSKNGPQTEGGDPSAGRDP